MSCMGNIPCLVDVLAIQCIVSVFYVTSYKHWASISPLKDVVKIGEMGMPNFAWVFTTFNLTGLGCRDWRWWATSLVSYIFSLPLAKPTVELRSNSPPKIKSIKIVDNPFDDIVPRITAAEKRVQQRAREEAHREREEEQRRKGAKK